jgi:hypothetical protein
MQRLFKRTTPIILAGVLALFGAACGGDDDGDDGDDTDDTTDDGDDDDDGTPDAAPPDAAPEVTHSGTVAITETTITNPGLPGEPLQGAVVSIGFVDDSTAIAPLSDFANNIGSCRITVFEGDAAATPTDEGPITVTGVASNGDFTCNATDGEYTCQSTTAAAAGASAEGAVLIGDGGGGTLTLDAAGFPETMVGMTVFLVGFGPIPSDVGFGVTDVAGGGDVLQLAGVPDTGKGGITGGADALYAGYVGAGPIPNVTAGFDFLDDGTTPVVIAKEESDLVAALDVSVPASGDGFTLAKGSALPHEFPTAAEEVVFTCAEKGCGANPALTGQLHAIIINGETTDGPIDGLPPFVMPDPVTSHATFQCAFLAAPLDDEATITAAAVEAILATNPTRVQVTVGRFSAIPASAASPSNVVVGHSLTGFTDIPPAGLRRN